ncbi:glucose dehydrogenase [FAD, quinone]-like [Macrobrachium rosenbergii]|uniref:glucose dehydrogenase [FAD, quinone]-like n=1 Tax=Macrobrachium rosenbergii TaxID=79674 RepID=UPI0034D3B75B
MTFSILRMIPIYLLRILLAAILHDTGSHDYDASNKLAPQYDFIIVGSGAAGGVLASRLSEVPGWKILLLEAGGAPPFESYVPALNLALIGGDADWNRLTTQQKYSLKGFKNNAAPYPLGRVLGGCTTINFMMYVRGNRRDYDNWEALGNPGWGYDVALKYFKKAEDYRGTRNKATRDYHGKGGPLVVDDKRWWAPLLNGFLKAGEQLGYRTIDPNGPDQIGFSVADITHRDGIRGSTAVSYIRPAASRPNLDVAFNAYVTQVLFDNRRRAIGVRFEQNGKLRTVLARREVILSAGAVSSPHILMLSGVGPARHLQEHGIPVLVDLPGVGQNFQDHPSIYGLTWTTSKSASSNFFNLINPGNVLQYVQDKQGPLTTPFGVEGNAWSLAEEGDPHWPDLQYLLISGTPGIDFGIFISDLIGFRRELFNEYFGPLKGKEGFCIGPMLTRAKSRGSITLASSNPKVPPNIDPNYFSHPDDVRTFIRGIKFARKIGNAPGLRVDYGARFHDQPLPGCKHLIVESDEYWACYVAHMATTTYHPAGTCKMAPPSDPSGVLNHRLQVRGTEGLRVVDASMMPLIVSGNLNAPVIMIGERAADLIKEDWGIPITPL